MQNLSEKSAALRALQAAALEARAAAHTAAKAFKKEFEAHLIELQTAVGNKAKSLLYIGTMYNDREFCATVKGNAAIKGELLPIVWGYEETGDEISISTVTRFMTEEEYNAAWALDEAASAEVEAPAEEAPEAPAEEAPVADAPPAPKAPGKRAPAAE